MKDNALDSINAEISYLLSRYVHHTDKAKDYKTKIDILINKAKSQWPEVNHSWTT